MTDPTHQSDAEIDKALGVDWPAKNRQKVEIEIDSTEYSVPSELANDIRWRKEWPVWVKCGRARYRVTAETAEAVCRGLLIAAEIAEAKERNA